MFSGVFIQTPGNNFTKELETENSKLFLKSFMNNFDFCMNMNEQYLNLTQEFQAISLSLSALY